MARVAWATVLLAAVFGAVVPLAAAAEGQRSVVAQARVAQLPPGDLIVRFLDLTVPAGQPAVTHMHGAGFAYAAEGPHVLTAGGKESVLNPGQAAWIGAQERHGHGAAAGGASRFWFVLVGPAATRGTPPTWPYPSARIVGESAPFPAGAGAQDAVLSEVRLPQPGDTAGPLGRNGPAGVAVLEGRASLGGRTLRAGEVVLQQPGDAATLTNPGPGPARPLALAVTPVAPPAQLPRTGEPVLPLLVAPAIGAAVLVLGLLRRRRSR